jgi:hypothetical protein
MSTDVYLLMAARELLAELRAYSSREAAQLRAALEQLLQRANSGEDVGDEIEEILGRWPAGAVAAVDYEEVALPERAEPEEPGAETAASPPGGAAPAAGLPAAPPAEPQERWLNCQIYERGAAGERTKLERGFKRNAEHELDAWVGPEQPGALVDKENEPVDDAVHGSRARLRLCLHLPGRRTGLVKSFVLPAQGPSKSVSFHFRVGDERRLELRLRLYQGNRLLQQTVIAGPVLTDPAHAKRGGFTIGAAKLATAPARSKGAKAAPSLVFDRRADGRPTLAAFRNGRAAWFDDDGLDRATATITAALSALTTSARMATLPLGDPNMASTLRTLAFAGIELRQVIEANLSDVFHGKPFDRLQLVMTHAGGFIPLEFVYDFPAPAGDATVCPHWAGDGAAHACRTGDHPALRPDGLSPVVCPHGFWGLRTVIERQLLRPDASETERSRDFAITVEHRPARPPLRPLTGGLFAASSRVRKNDVKGVLDSLKRVAGDACAEATDWDDWAAKVQESHPTVLVLLSHSVDDQGVDALEIGEDSRRNAAQLEAVLRQAVAQDHPLVLLLGCHTNQAFKSVESFVTDFYCRNATLVAGTITPVLASHAARVARQVLDTMGSVISSPARDATIGDLLLEVRRALLASGEPIALALTALGDEDWRVAPTGR